MIKRKFQLRTNGILKEHEAGVSVADQCRKHGSSRCQRLQIR